MTYTIADLAAAVKTCADGHMFVFDGSQTINISDPQSPTLSHNHALRPKGLMLIIPTNKLSSRTELAQFIEDNQE